MPSTAPIQPPTVEFQNIFENRNNEASILNNIAETKQSDTGKEVSVAPNDVVTLTSTSHYEQTNAAYTNFSIIDNNATKAENDSDTVESPSDGNVIPAAAISAYQYTNYTTSYEKNSDISIVTKEGDRVSLSSDVKFYGAYTSFDGFSQTDTNLEQVTYENITMDIEKELSYSVNGDISKEEASDIRKVIKLINKAVDKFFSGDISQAIAKVIKIGNLENISAFEANVQVEKNISIENYVAAVAPPAIESLEKVKPETGGTSPEISDQTLEKSPIIENTSLGTGTNTTEELLQDASDEIEETPATTITETVNEPMNKNGVPDEPIEQVVAETDSTIVKIEEPVEKTPEIKSSVTEAEEPTYKEIMLPIWIRLDKMTNELITDIENVGIRGTTFKESLEQYFSRLIDRISEANHKNTPIFEAAEKIQNKLFEKLQFIA